MSRHHLLLVTVDSLRHDALGCTGSPSVTTAALDDLAGRGVLFSEAISNGPRTPSAFPAILSSLYPLTAGDRKGLPVNVVTWAEAMRRAGYRTAGFNPSNPYLTVRTGYDRGFDTFVDFWDLQPAAASRGRRGPIKRWKKAVQDAVARRNLGALMLLQALLMRRAGQYLTGEFIVKRALEWLSRQDGPSFMWLHLMDLHFPYQPLPGERTLLDRADYAIGLALLGVGRRRHAARTLRRLYDRRVELVDRLAGSLATGLDHLGLTDHTTLVVTSDHGERFGERGDYAHGPDLCEELIRVPLLISGPSIPSGLQIEQQVSLVDLAPTLLELHGAPIPETFQGASFLPLLRGTPGATGREWVFSQARHSGSRRSWVGVEDIHEISSCRGHGWKLVVDQEGPREELYDLDKDPDEEQNLIEERPETAARLRRVLEEHRQLCRAAAAPLVHAEHSEPGADDDELRRRLAALGYL